MTTQITKHESGKAIDATVSSNIDVRTHHETHIEVAVDGDEDGIRDVKVTDGANGVSIVERDSATGGDVVVSGGHSTMHIRGGNFGSITVGRGSRVVVNGVDVTDIVNGNAGSPAPRQPTKITVLVPAGSGSPLRLAVRGECQATVGDITAPVNITASGASKVAVGAVGKCRVRASGSTTVTTTSVVGDTNLWASGMARVVINGGIVGTLEADASGMAQIEVDAAVDTAELSASGMARIVVNRLKGRHSADRSGMATIHVPKVGQSR